MAELEWTVEGRRFRNAEEYQAALRDKELIDSITGNLKLDNPKRYRNAVPEVEKKGNIHLRRLSAGNLTIIFMNYTRE